MFKIYAWAVTIVTIEVLFSNLLKKVHAAFPTGARGEVRGEDLSP
jgi:hypothetical protein